MKLLLHRNDLIMKIIFPSEHDMKLTFVFRNIEWRFENGEATQCADVEDAEVAKPGANKLELCCTWSLLLGINMAGFSLMIWYACYIVFFFPNHRIFCHL